MVGAQILFVLVALMIFMLGWRFSVNSRGIEINHCTLCAFGFLYYWLLPIAVGLFRLLSDDKIVTMWHRFYVFLSETQIDEFLLLTAAISGAFFYGSHLGSKIPRRRMGQYKPERFNIRLLSLPLFLGVVFCAVYGYIIRGSLFHGYTAITSLDTNGPFVAGSVFLFSVALMYLFRRMEIDPGRSFVSELSNPYFLTYAVVAALVLSLGDRLYVVSAVIMLFVVYTIFYKRLKLVNFIVLISVVSLLAGLLGVFRLGHGFERNNPIAMIAYEPILTSISLVASLKQGIHQFIRFPVYLMSDFTNLIPSAILGASKSGLRLDPTDDGFALFSPLGALNSYVSFMINFGDFGTVACFFLFGFGLSRLRALDKSMMSRLVYVMVTGWLAFSFFRDPFYDSIVKTITEFSILLPFALLFTMRWLSRNVFVKKPIDIPRTYIPAWERQSLPETPQ